MHFAIVSKLDPRVVGVLETVFLTAALLSRKNAHLPGTRLGASACDRGLLHGIRDHERKNCCRATIMLEWRVPKIRRSLGVEKGG